MGLHHSRLGNSLLHIPQREYHQHMTRASLTLSHLACCLPLNPNTENGCVHVHMCQGQQPLWKRRRRKKRVMGHHNMLVSNGYATNVIDMKALCVLRVPTSTVLFKLSTGPGISLPSNKVTRQTVTHCLIYMGNPHQLHTNHCPIWATAQQESVCVCACIRGGMFPFPLCLKHVDSVRM